MQYLLTEEEYKSITAERDAKIDGQTKTIQHLCTIAANLLPTNRDPIHRPGSWGCKLTTEEMKQLFYVSDFAPGLTSCDGCPVRSRCPDFNKKS